MPKMIQLSIFGQYSHMNTSNADIYMRLIEFFLKSQYKPYTTNELILNNIQPTMLIMPSFISPLDFYVEITSSRVNFKKNFSDETQLEDIVSSFTANMSESIKSFVEEFKIKANRVAVNYSEDFPFDISNGVYKSSDYFCDENISQSSIRTEARNIISGEMCNTILEKHVSAVDKISRCTYDINTVAENTNFRFDTNIIELFEQFSTIICQIKRGVQ